MEEETFGEQPTGEDNVPVAEAIDDKCTPSSSQDGSLGKFKDAESLLSAYNNLQAEFTRKCQKLSELEKNTTCAEAVYDKEDWEQKVSSFLKENKDAKKFAQEISNEILINPDLKNRDDALDLAYLKVISKKYKEPSELVRDDKFIEDYVLSNEQIQQKLLEKLQKSNNLPPILGSKGGEIAFSTKKQATNLEEAKKMVEAILTKR